MGKTMCTYIHKVFSVVHLKGNVFAIYQQGQSSYVDSCMFVWKVVKSLIVNKLLNIKQDFINISNTPFIHIEHMMLVINSSIGNLL